MQDPLYREKVEKTLQLEPQERGYEVLLIEPYYKSWFLHRVEGSAGVSICPLLLTFLDLYHFPLRGQEQAEYLAKRAPEMEHLYGEG